MFGLIKELVPQNRLQKTLFKNLNNQLQVLNHIVKLTQTIELNKPYTVTLLSGLKRVLICTGYNKESFKCQVLADSGASPAQILWVYNKNKVTIKNKATNISYKAILDFKEFKEEDAPLIINWNYVSPEFKEKYFKSR